MKFHSLTKMLTVGLIAVMTAALLAGCGSESSQKKFLNIATGGTAGTYYPIGGAMAEILNKEIPGMNASAQSTGATVANINMLKDNSVDLAIVQNDITYYAVNGTEMFQDKKVDNIRGIASLYPETCQFVTLDKSGIKSIKELKGKRAAFLSGGYPTSSVLDIASQNKVRLLPIDADKAEALIAKYPFYTKTTIPAGTYAGFDEDVPTISVMAMLVATDKVDDKMGYDIAKAIFTNLDRLQAAHSVGKLITKDTALKGMSLPMNAGAEKFFKE